MWVKKRHRIFINILRPFVKIYLKLKYKFTHDKPIVMSEGSVILCNHTTTLDPVMVSYLFKDHVYYMASKDIFNHRCIGKLLKFWLNPIPKEKSKKSDLNAIKCCMRVAKENGNIGIFPEGNRTFSGELGNVDKSIVKLIKSLKKPLVIANINGGYPTDPRWGLSIRKGNVNASIKKIYQFDEIKDMDNEELYELIVNSLKVDDYNYYPEYKGKNLAEYLEKIFYICPVCGHMHTIYTKGDKIYCKDCGLEVTHLPSLNFEANNDSFNFKNVKDWYNWQIEVIKEKDYSSDEVIYQDEVGLYLSVPFKKKQLLSFGQMKIYNNRFTFDSTDGVKEFIFDEITAVTLLGKKKMNIYVGDDTYQIFNTPKTNLLKYMQLFYVIKNIGGNYEFLGL